MNWESIGAIAELISGIGVIATLFYLASQIRRYTKATYAETYQRFTESMNSTNQLIASDEGLSSLVAQLDSNDFEDYTPEERVRLSQVLTCHFRALESLYYHRSEGAATERAWKSQAGLIEEVVKFRAVRTWWPLTASIFDEDFRKFVEQSISVVSAEDRAPKWFGENNRRRRHAEL
jgi:hypothetical protein